MEQIELIEVNVEYADDIWQFRQEILECDAESEDQFAGCMSLDATLTDGIEAILLDEVPEVKKVVLDSYNPYQSYYEF